MIVAERKQRRELGFANMELRAAQELLMQTARQGERLRIARELHDTLGHHLTGLAVNLELAGRLAGAEARPVIERSHLLARLLLNDVRETVSTMRDGGGGGAVEIGEILRAMAARLAGLQVWVEVPEGGYAVEAAEPAHVLVRCAQEAVTNAMKHSGGRNIWITVGVEEADHRLVVRDDGGGTAKVKAGNGLRGMRERVEAAGGVLEIETAVGRGFEVRVRLPRRRREAGE